MFDFYTLSVLVFVVVLAVYVYRDRKNFKRESGIFLLRRTGHGKEFLERLGTRWPRAWKAVGVLGVALGFYMSLSLVWTLISLAYRNMSGAGIPGLAFVLPIPTATVVSGPGWLGVPFWYYIISIALLIIVHEGFHGVMTAREQVRIKSLGTGLLAVIPLAFVEPDEQQLQKKGFWPQQRVFAAGSFANFILAFVAFGLMVTIAPVGNGLYVQEGVQFSVLPGTAAADVGLNGTIIAIGNHTIREVANLTAALESTRPGTTILVVVNEGGQEKAVELTLGNRPSSSYLLTLDQAVLVAVGQTAIAENMAGGESWIGYQQKIVFWEKVRELRPDLGTEAEIRTGELKVAQLEFDEPGYLGIEKTQTVQTARPGLEAAAGGFTFVIGLLSFLVLINFGVGAFNLLPLKPLDGGRMWELVFRKVSKRYARQITMAVGLLVFFLIVAGFVLPMVR